MNSTGCISLASSLLKTRGTPGFFGQLAKQPFLQLNREYHDPCEPRHLSWQWRVKDSPDVQRCSKLCLKSKSCPKKRFFPRFKKSFVPRDILACDPPKEKPKTWGEYLSFLLPDDITSKPQMGTCRKMLEHRRRKCMEADNYSKCVQGECWPLPTEWYGQGVLHISELALTRPPYRPVESFKPCPPPSSMITKCVTKKLPVCPGNDLFCLEEVTRKMPYSQFKGADSDGGPPSITLRCPIKYVPELLPDKNQDRTYKLSCKTYGDFKNVECPPQMFNRYMDVDLNSKNLLPIPTTMPGYKPQREVKKGVCGRQTLLRPPSARNFSTGRAFLVKEYPEFIRIVNTNHLQPGRSAICFDKLVERAGMDAELLNKPIVERPLDTTQRLKMFTEKELEKHEIEAKLSEESAEEKQKRIDSKKSKLQMLIEKRDREVGKKQQAPNTVKSEGNFLGDSVNQPFGGRMIDLEEVPYQRSRLHTSAVRSARKPNDTGQKSEGQGDEKICSGCPGIRSMGDAKKPQGKLKCSRGGAKGKCKVNRAMRPEDRLNPLYFKCKAMSDSPCMKKRCEPCLIGVANRFIHLTPIPSQPLKERIIFPISGLFVNHDIKMSFSQKSKDLLDQCCDQMEQLKQQIESMNKAPKDQNKDEAKEMLDQCCEQMDQLKKQLASLKKDKGKMKNDPESKELLDQCCEQQEQLKKQIESLQKGSSKKSDGTGGGQGKKKKEDPCDEDLQGSEKKGGKKGGSQSDPCEKSTKEVSKKDGGGEGGKKDAKSYEPCKPVQTGVNCKKIKDKKEKAEDCAKYLLKQNEKLKKELEDLKKQQQEAQKSQKKKDPGEQMKKDKKKDPCANRKKDESKGDDCEQMKKDKKKAEQTVKALIMENEKLKKEMAIIKKQMSQSGDMKKPKKEKSDPKNVCDKNKESKKESPKQTVDKDVQKALEECMKKCTKKVQKEQIKKQVKAEKEKCKKELDRKKRELMAKHEDDGNVVAAFLQSVCCKLQELAKKKKKKPKC